MTISKNYGTALIFFKMELYSCFRKSAMGALESLNLLKGMDP